MASSQLQRSSDPVTIDALPRVGEPISASQGGKKSVAENESEFHNVVSTPPQRKEKGKKRGLDDLTEKTELSKQPTKKRKCRPKVADDKFSLKTKKAKVKISKSVKVKPISSKKDLQNKRKYVRKKKEHANVAVRPPEASNDAAGREVDVSEEALLDVAKGEDFKGTCRRALEFIDESLTHMSTPFAADSKAAPEPPSLGDRKLSDKADEPHLLEEGKINNSEAEDVYISKDRLLNLAEQKDSSGPSREILDYSDVHTTSATVAMSEPDTEMELKASESLRSEIGSSKKDTSTVIVYVRNKKTQPSINIQHNVACHEPPSAAEVKVGFSWIQKNESRGGTVSGGTMLDSAGEEHITGSRRQGLNIKDENAMSISQTNKNNMRALSTSDSKNIYPLEMLHIPLVSNGRNMRACQCIQLMRKCNRNMPKIKKQLRMLRKKRVDVSSFCSPFRTPKQVRSKEPVFLYQEVCIPTRKQRSKGLTRRREFSSQLTVPQFNKSAASTIEQQCSMEVPKTDVWPTDNLGTRSKDTSRPQEEKVCVRSQEVDPHEEPQPKRFDPLFTINEHLFANDMMDDSGYESQNYTSIQSDSALETGLDYSTMNAVSCRPLYSNLHSMGPWTSEQVPVHINVYSIDNFYPSQSSLSLQTDYSVCMGADFHTTGRPPLWDTTYHHNQLLNPVQFCVMNEQESIPNASGGLWTISNPNLQNVFDSRSLVPHLELDSTREADDYSVNCHLLVPYCEPTTSIHGQELVTRVDNSLDVINDTGNRALITSMKKKKVIPHVNFDSKTMPMWRALMGIGDPRDHQCNEDEESKKWWREERHVFKEKVQAFISCMHKIQGNRRFSQWKGSVLDSVMGVFLTQNVSDHLSSSAYMSLAAKYPVGPTHAQKAAQEECEVTGTSQESCGSNEAVLVSVSDLSDQESLNDRLLDGEHTARLQNAFRTGSNNEFADNNQVKDDNVMPTVGLSGFEEWLSLQEQMTQPEDSSHPKSETKECLSQQEQITLPQNPSHNSETEDLLSQHAHTTEPRNSSHSKSESKEVISHQHEQTIQPQNSSHPKSETEELFSHQQEQTRLSQDSSLPKYETDDLLSHQQEQRWQRQDSSHPKSETEMKIPGPKIQKNKAPEIDWLKIKRKYCNEKRERNEGHTDSVDWDAVRRAPIEEVANAIKKRGQHNILAASMQNALNRIFSELGSLDLEWLRDTPPDVTKDFLLSIEGLGLKSVECIRLLALEQVAFPVDTNVGRIAVRLGWVDLKDVPEGLQFHLLEQYPLMDAIQKYLWPRLCELDQPTLYELHYQMITFGKVFCKKRSPYCNACPLRASCKYFASAYVSARLPITDSPDTGSSQALPLIGHSGTQSQTTNHEPIVEMPTSPEPYVTRRTSPEPCIESTSPQLYTEMPTSPHPYIEMPTSPQPYIEMPTSPQPYTEMATSPQPYTEMATSPQPYTEIRTSPQPYTEMPTSPKPYTEMPTSEGHHQEVLEPRESFAKMPESMNPTVEMPRTPESEHGDVVGDIEDLYTDVPKIPTIVLNDDEFIANLSKYIDEKKFQTGAEISNALVVSAQAARIPARKLKNIKDLRTEHLVYEIPDSHPLLSLHGLGKRDPNDPCFYLLSIWSPDESATLSSQTVKENSNCVAENLNSEEKCSDNCKCRQHDMDHVLGTFMIPCRTAMQGRFPLNGTYFQVNEVFADDESSHRPVKIPRSYLWNLNKCIAYCGSSTSSITTGLTTEEIQVCFWRDYLCVRGFDRRTRNPKELVERLHKLKTATQTKRSSVTNQGKPKRNKNGEKIGEMN